MRPIQAIIAHLPKAPSATASTQASVPPATMTSASPARMRWNASPMESAPAAHAVAAALLGPRSLCRMLTAPAGEFANILVTRKGLILHVVKIHVPHRSSVSARDCLACSTLQEGQIACEKWSTCKVL